MAGVPTRVVDDILLYGFLLGAGVLFLFGSNVFTNWSNKLNINIPNLPSLPTAQAISAPKVVAPAKQKTVNGTYPLGSCYDSVSKTGVKTKCWRNYPCGGKNPVAICQYTCDKARSIWLSKYKCK